MEAWFPLGWTHYLIGGVAIGVGVSLLYALTGLIGGMSTVFSSSWSYVSSLAFLRQARFVASRRWRLVYALGLMLGAALAWIVSPHGVITATGLPWWQLALGGALVGFGARLSNGCTSGHGICGMASLQAPSIVSVIIFLITAMITAQLVVPMLGGL